MLTSLSKDYKSNKWLRESRFDGMISGALIRETDTMMPVIIIFYKCKFAAYMSQQLIIYIFKQILFNEKCMLCGFIFFISSFKFLFYVSPKYSLPTVGFPVTSAHGNSSMYMYV